MTTLLLAVLGLGLTSALGFLLASALARRSGMTELAAAFPLGALIVTLLGMLMLNVGLPLARTPWLLASIAAVVMAWLLRRRLGQEAPSESMAPPRAGRHDTALLALGALLLAVQLVLLVAGIVRIPTIADWDGWAIWAFKAKAFFVDQGVTRYLAHGDDYYFTWPSRPCLSSFYQAFLYACIGHADESVARLVNLAFFISLLLAFFASLRRVVATGPALLSTALLASLPTVAYVATAGLANLVLGTYLFLALSSLERARVTGRWTFVVGAGLFLGGASLARDEGLALSAVLILVASFSLPGRVRLGPAAAAFAIACACYLPWLLLVAPYSLWSLSSSYLTTELVARAGQHLGDAGAILQTGAIELTRPLEQTRSSPLEESIGLALAWPVFALALLRVRALRVSNPLAVASALVAVSGLLLYGVGFWLFPYESLDALRDNWLFVFDRHALAVLPLAAYATAVAFSSD